MTQFADMITSVMVPFSANLLMFASSYTPWEQMSGQEQIKRAVKSIFKSKAPENIAIDKKV